ncbi:hypothetical protein J2Z83_002798 [Virgibacillus natechei]|uniref:Uncharacterized protein n=1 Tax=Virgibacillus natechei TaxID=1216297 RepID=A0ABS4II81_9BACI|nr:hypothetical protein [Virgibacillus natechei]MBP1970662.1 hypothetical protein [Virgibacillus natechei]UZD13952.1 hypothetical protein OLD84_05295 [Virgibacillus natechei]
MEFMIYVIIIAIGVGLLFIVLKKISDFFKEQDAGYHNNHSMDDEKALQQRKEMIANQREILRELRELNHKMDKENNKELM